MRVDAETELVIAVDIARRLDLSPQRINVLAGGPGFPKPLGKLGQDDPGIDASKVGIVSGQLIRCLGLGLGDLEVLQAELDGGNRTVRERLNIPGPELLGTRHRLARALQCLVQVVQSAIAHRNTVQFAGNLPAMLHCFERTKAEL